MVSICSSCTLSLYAGGKITGIVFDSSGDANATIPDREAFVASHAILRLDLTDSGLTIYLMMFLNNLSSSFLATARGKIIRDIKK